MTFEERIKEIIDRNNQLPDGTDKDDINKLLMWFAAYKRRVDGWNQACDEVIQRAKDGIQI